MFLTKAFKARKDGDEMVYKGIIRERTKERKIFLILIGALTFYLSYRKENYLYMAIAVLLSTAVFFQKEHLVSEKGVTIRYKLFGMTVNNHWNWDVITAIRPDFKKAKPYIFLEIAKDVTIRAFVFKLEDAEAVMALAKRMNPDIYVDDRSEAEREKAEEERNAKIAYAKERALASRKARKKTKR